MFKSLRLLCLTILINSLLGCGFHMDKPVEELIPRYTNEVSKFIQVDGLNVHYRDQGSGPTVILLHGSNSSLQTWEGWVEELHGDFRMISLDLPGHGLTGPDPQSRYYWPQQAEFVEHFAQALGVRHFSIVGNSLGGAIAWHLALQHPEQVDKLILIDSRGIPPEEPIPFIFWAYGVPGLNNLLTVFTPRWVVGMSIRSLYGDPDKVSDAMIDRYFDLTLRTGNRDATKYRFTHMDTYEELPRLNELKAPTLIMWGQKDTWILPKYAQGFLARIKDARMIEYPGLGHTPMEEAPEITAVDAKRFLLGR